VQVLVGVYMKMNSNRLLSRLLPWQGLYWGFSQTIVSKNSKDVSRRQAT